MALNLSAGRKGGGEADPKERIPHEQANRTKLPKQYTRPDLHLFRALEFTAAATGTMASTTKVE
jgi:hypothetical protein